MSAASHRADVVIVGGAAVGSSVAYFLARDPDFWGSVIVIERDPTYATASTTLSAASVRQQFSTPVNIQMSQFAVQVLKHPDWWFPLLQTVPDFGFVEGGYLFLASEAGAPALWANHAVQVEHGASVEVLTPDELSHRYPWLTTDDIAGGSLGTSGEGWFDATALMQAFQQSARASGVTYVTGEVTGILSFGGRIDAVAGDDELTPHWLVRRARRALALHVALRRRGTRVGISGSAAHLRSLHGDSECARAEAGIRPLDCLRDHRLRRRGRGRTGRTRDVSLRRCRGGGARVSAQPSPHRRHADRGHRLVAFAVGPPC